MKSENFEMAISEIIWLLTLLANQSLLIYNLKNPKDKKYLLTEEEVELLTTPADLVAQKEAIVKAMSKGTNKNIESEIIVELMRSLIYENSRKVMNQDEYNKNIILTLRNTKKSKANYLN